jgi:peptidoglycan LD-endopeptidase CwlK
VPTFSARSRDQLATCDQRLQVILNEAIKLVDFSVIEGHRGEEAQNKAFDKGLSKVRWPNGKHNSFPSRAVDIAPYPIDWSERAAALARFAFISGVIHTIAARLGIAIRFGWDWNRNLDPRDESFLDWPHVELVDQ